MIFKINSSTNYSFFRVHKNMKKEPHNAITFAEKQDIVSFIKNYSEVHAILLPGRIPGFKRFDVQLLPCSTTKKKVWQQYDSAAKSSGSRTVCYTTFCRVWRLILPFIVVAKPRSDLCWTCQKNAVALQHINNTSEENKSQVMPSTQCTLNVKIKHSPFSGNNDYYFTLR